MTVGASIQQVISLHPLGEKKNQQCVSLNVWAIDDLLNSRRHLNSTQESRKHARKQHLLLCRRSKSSSWQQHRDVMIPSAATRWQAWNGCNLLQEWLRGVYFRSDCHFLSPTLCTACRSIVHGSGYAGTEVNTMHEICKKSLEDIFFFLSLRRFSKNASRMSGHKKMGCLWWDVFLHHFSSISN